jgi:hypothetical protein
MKKNHAFVTVMCLTVLSFCYLFSCQKKNNVKKDEPIVTSAITVFGNPTPVYNYIRNPVGNNASHHSAREKSPGMETIYADMEAESMNAFVSKVKINLKNASVIPSDVNSFIIYSQEEGLCTDYGLITGISTTQTTDDGKLHYRLFTVQNSDVTELTGYNIETDIISSTEILFFAKEFGSKTCLIFNVPAGAPGHGPGSSNTLAKAIIDVSGKLALPVDGGGGGGATCSMCGAPVQGVCIKDVYGFNCSNSGDQDCVKGAILAKGIETGQIPDETAMDSEQAYAYRDGFMQSSAIGRKYINYYYKLSYLTSAYKSQSINLSNIADLVSLGSELYTICNKMTLGNSSDIIISSSFKELANTIINDYKQISANGEFQAILADIQNDLDHFEGKTKEEVLSEIE